jgi:electron transport complex protein RnfC
VLRTFKKGGVHPAENKISAASAIEVLPLPSLVSIPLCQHLGAPSTPVVNRNDLVKAGQLIGKSSGYVSANVHSSVCGKVVKIEEVMETTGYRKPAITIEVSGDEWMPEVDRSTTLVKDISLSHEQILSRIQDAGIVGMGGATFPTHVKLTLPKGKKARILIINGVECEPFLTSDHRLMLERAEELLVGIRIMMKALEVDKAIIGIENNKPDAIEHLTQLSIDNPWLRVVPLNVKYPQGGEKQLIKALINREVPSGGLPIDVGTVVQNVGTAVAVYEAVQKNKPLVERVVTVTGKSVARPSNLLARIGTPVSKLVEAAGGIPENTGKVINGGPMMGRALNSLDVPVTKGTSGIVIMPMAESARREVKPCIRCAKCISVCPMGLEPYLLMALAERKMMEKVEANRAMDCMECGSCSFTCPSSRPLLDYIRYGKTEVLKIIRSRKK